MNLVSLFLESTIVVKTVIVVLILFFNVCLYIVIYKSITLMRARALSREFLEVFWNSKSFDDVYQASGGMQASPIAQIFRAGYIELAKIRARQAAPAAAAAGTEMKELGQIENIERALARTHTEELTKIESLIPFLATTGSTAPFIGLFGTVIGIMHSFSSIAEKKAVGIATVAPGIAEALFATAIGLVAAVPAVIAYNFFLRKIRVVSSEMSTFSHDFLNITKRYFLA